MAEKNTKIISISNRLPYTFFSKDESLVSQKGTGGLATALSGLNNAHFLGTLLVEQKEDEIEEAYRKAGATPVFIEKALYDSFYNCFSNQVLWLLFHHQTVPLEILKAFDKHFAAYKEVNERFAAKLFTMNPDTEVVFVQDYHFMLLPRLLKAKRPRLRVGFYLHTPFPSLELFETLPCAKELLAGVLAADFVGVHTDGYCKNLERAAARYSLPCANLKAVPVGLNSESFAPVGAAKCPPFFRFLGVDRRDTSKGILHKLAMFERLLENRPELVGKTQLCQVLVPSRQAVLPVETLYKEILAVVDRLNKRFDVVVQPVRLIDRAVTPEELRTLYQSSQALLATPLKDGLNLVVFEYLVAQNTATPGVALLSRFAGAHTLLESGVLSLNPFDIPGSAKLLERAMKLDSEKRRSLISKVRHLLTGNRAEKWLQECLNSF